VCRASCACEAPSVDAPRPHPHACALNLHLARLSHPVVGACFLRTPSTRPPRLSGAVLEWNCSFHPKRQITPDPISSTVQGYDKLRSRVAHSAAHGWLVQSMGPHRTPLWESGDARYRWERATARCVAAGRMEDGSLRGSIIRCVLHAPCIILEYINDKITTAVLSSAT
jgi:hypothetical protein